MAPLSKGSHKTLLPVGGRPIIDNIVESCIANGIQDVAVVLGHEGATLKKHLEERFSDVQFQWIWNQAFRTTNNIESLRLALDAVGSDTDLLVIETDLVFRPELLAPLLETEHRVAALVDRFQLGMDGTVVDIDVPGDRIVDVITPERQGVDFPVDRYWKTLNIHLWRAGRSLEMIHDHVTSHAGKNSNQYYEAVLARLVEQDELSVHAVLADGQWAELDDPNDHRLADILWGENSRRRLLQTFGGWWSVPLQDHAFIRNMYFPTSAMLAEMRRATPMLLYTYGSIQTTLDEKVADVVGYPRDATIALAGASQAYPILRRLLPRSARRPDPTFGEYMRWAGPTFKDQLTTSHPVPEVGPDDELLILCNPNNPTGSMISPAAIAELAQEHPELTVLVDESFAAFEPHGSVVPHAIEGNLTNIVVLTSLSKAYGCPGLRLGALFTLNQELRSGVRNELPIWSVPSHAEFFLEQCLKNSLQFERSIERTTADRARLAKQISALPFVQRVYNSAANFLLVKTNIPGDDGEALADLLFEKDRILLKSVHAGLHWPEAAFRIAVRLPRENEHLVDRLATRWGELTK